MTDRDLFFMCADTGAVVSLTQSAGSLRTLAFLTTGETLWAEQAMRRAFLPDGRSAAMSGMSALFTAPAQVVLGEPMTARQVPLNVSVTVEPAGVGVSLPGLAPRPVVAVQVSGSIALGSVIRHVHGTGWLSAQETVDGCRTRAAFQDRSAAFLTQGIDDTAAALMVNTETRRVPVHDVVVGGPSGGPAYHLRYDIGGGLPVRVSGEIRDTEQHLTLVEPASDGDGWVARSATPFVFVRSGLTGLGLVERTTRAVSASVSPAAVSHLPDPY